VLNHVSLSLPSGRGSKKEYAAHGYGEDPENNRANISFNPEQTILNRT